MSKKLIFILFIFAAASLCGKTVFISETDGLADFLSGRGISHSDIYAFSNEVLQNLTTEETAKLKGLVKSKKLTVAGTAYKDINLPLLVEVRLENDAKKQLEKGRNIYSVIFDTTPSLFFPYMGIYDEKTLFLIKEAGYSSIVSTTGATIVLSTAAHIPSQELDFTAFINEPIQIFAWKCVKQASEKLVEYSTSTSYSPEIFDAASEELYLIEKPVWFENYISNDADKRKDSDLWFRASVSNIYRIIGLNPPQEVISPLWSSLSNPADLAEGTTGQYLVFFADNADSVKISSCDLLGIGIYLINDSSSQVTVAASASATVFDIFVASRAGESIDIYIDMNNKSDAGSTSFIPGHKGFTDSLSAWEYAVSVFSNSADLYKYDLSGSPPDKIDTFPVIEIEGGISIAVPQKYIKGDPRMWGYIVAGFLEDGSIFDVVGSEPPSDDTVIQIPAMREK